MCAHVCPWWGGYFIDNRLRRWLHDPEQILAPHVRPGMTAMDFGCGMGMFAIAMAKLAGPEGRVIAVDLQQKMLDVLAGRAARAGVGERIRTHRSDHDSLGWNEPIDFALAFYSAHEVRDQGGLLRDFHAVIRPGGRLLLVEPIVHVTAAAFQRMIASAEPIGFRPQERPRVRLSRAVVLEAVA